MTTSFHQLLDEIRAIKRSEKDVGDRFEEVVQVFFNHDSQMQQMYSDAMSWSEWVKKHRVDLSAQDDGIDLVARIRDEHGGGYAAIQAKCRQGNYVLRAENIDRFYTKATTLKFDHLIYIDTTEVNPSKNFQETIEKNQITHIRTKELAESAVDWESYVERGEKKRRKPKEPRIHQNEAVEKVREGLKVDDRGQIIMACGTGKTYTGLLVAERVFDIGSRILVLVPSLALMSQMIREWHADATQPLRSYSVCSDIEVGRHGRISDDVIQLTPSELMIPPTTDASKLAQQARNETPDSITVVFGTYHSLEVVHEAQHKHGLPDFDLIVCDEAHRTTGQFDQAKDKKRPAFTRIHDTEYVRSRKRLYMTATPRIYTASSKSKAAEGAIELSSMDDAEKYGKVLFYKSFAWAVENKLLTDYRVIVLAIDESTISRTHKDVLESEDSDIKLDDATKVVGCYRALIKDAGPDRADEFKGDTLPSKRALAFCNTIKNSEIISKEFNRIVQKLAHNDAEHHTAQSKFICSTKHIDGTSGAHERNRKLSWLGEEPEENELRLLSNVRCLGEGVDVPSLDAIVFFHPRKSQIDVVQAVGRVMRRAPNKQFGYVVLPIAIPSGKSPVESLNNNKTYETVWQILNALRAHDERLEAEINRLQFEGENSGRIIFRLPETASGTLHTERGPPPPDPPLPPNGGGSGETPLPFNLDDAMLRELATAVFAQVAIKKVGRRTYWENWAHDVGKVAQTQITRIRTALETDKHSRANFHDFLEELRDDLNPSVTDEQAIELLAQHIVTRPVFNALFEGHDFIEQNSVSIAMERVLQDLDKRNLEKETESLTNFYDAVKWRIQGTKTAGAKQQLVRELYDKFFRRAFPRTTEMLGIAFTPVEIVDYIIHSVEHLLNKHFGKSMTDKNVHIIDPFVGTGTFITCLLQSGIIQPKDLRRKYQKEIHANEIVLLAYYVAGINIEAVYHEIRDDQIDDYEPFERIVFQDTFQSAEQSNQLKGIFPFNHERIEYQQNLPLTVVFGNPPYSKGQKTENDKAANIRYPSVDERISSSYANAVIGVSNKNMLYDSYVRAFRWASDRVGSRGIVGFVTGAGWLDGNAASGIRSCFESEFAHIYIVNLRGNANTQGETRRKEGGNVFDSASKSAITITFLVKDPSAQDSANILYHDIGDYLKQHQKLGKLKEFENIGNTPTRPIQPNKMHDWIRQRNTQFEQFLPLLVPSKDGLNKGIFKDNTLGLGSGRDAWLYNFSQKRLRANIAKSIQFYNQEFVRFREQDRIRNPRDFVVFDPKKIAWSREVFKRFKEGDEISLSESCFFLAEYRPFTRTWCYRDHTLVTNSYGIPKFFDSPDSRMRTICTSGVGASEPSVWITEYFPDLNSLSAGCRAFPEQTHKSQETTILNEVVSLTEDKRIRQSNVNGVVFSCIYPEFEPTARQVFHYVYGLLSCPEYQQQFLANLQKEAPRVPAVSSVDDFYAFVECGKQLADLHVGYMHAEEFPVSVTWVDSKLRKQLDKKALFQVVKMKFGKKNDRSTIQYNPYVKVSGIPEETYEFKVNGKSCVEWVMDRQCISTHKDSGIENDANDFANETMHDPEYPLKLLKKAITVGLKTRDIQNSMPPLRIHKKMVENK